MHISFQILNMRVLLVASIAIAAATGCKEQISKFVFDASKMSTRFVYLFEYDQGKKVSRIEKSYTIMFGQIADSIITTVDYIYNDRGLLEKEIIKHDFKEKPSFEIYDYNSEDSLVRDISINDRGDTISWVEYEYFPDGRNLVFRRFLVPDFDSEKDFGKSITDVGYDTTMFYREYYYENGLCDSFRQYNSQDRLTKVVKYEYDGNHLVREFHWPSDWTLEPIQKTTYYDYSKSETDPDYFSIDLAGDTVDLCKNEFQNDSLVTRLTVYDYGEAVDKEFLENGRLIGMIGLHRGMNWKVVEAFEYYPNGDLKEIKSYSGEINDGPTE